jgi:hypothetical protein
LSLPYVDEHCRQLHASREQAWDGLLHSLARLLDHGPTPVFARLLGCHPARSSGPRPLQLGSELPGFRVVSAEAPGRLVLQGSHRFARYQLTFYLDPETLLRAETRAEFPGLAGKLYRLLVISSGLHVLATRAILRKIEPRRTLRNVDSRLT